MDDHRAHHHGQARVSAASSHPKAAAAAAALHIGTIGAFAATHEPPS
jgi:hypothetical protein